MKALLLSAYNHLEFVDMPAPIAGPDEVLVRVEACGICGSDVHGLDGSTGRRIPPIVMGHEAAGVVAAVGSGVNDIAVGDRVTFDSTISCGKCHYCLHGDINLCDNREVIGVSCGDYRRHGAFAEYVSVPRRILYALPDELPFEEAAMLEAISVAMHAVRVSEAAAGQTALVIGAGMIGLLTLQAARAAGCSKVYVSDIDPTRLALAVTLGADHVLPFTGKQLAARVAQLTDAEVLQIRETIDRDYMVEGDLRREVAINIKRLMDLGAYRGLRHRKQLPVRGQRTHTNARTRKGKAKPIAGKKK